MTLIGVAVAVGLVIGTLAFWHNKKQPQSLLPAHIAEQASDFTPYFYSGQVPAGYHMDSSKISFDQGVLIIPLSHGSKAAVVLTEQDMPTSVSQKQVQQNGDKVSNTAGPATINDIEGRLLGTMIVTNNQRRTLLLLNAPASVPRSDLSALLQGLRPAQ